MNVQEVIRDDQRSSFGDIANRLGGGGQKKARARVNILTLAIWDQRLLANILWGSDSWIEMSSRNNNMKYLMKSCSAVFDKKDFLGIADTPTVLKFDKIMWYKRGVK